MHVRGSGATTGPRGASLSSAISFSSPLTLVFAPQDDFLKSMPDFHRISKRFQKGAANLEDVVRVYQALLLLPGLITILENGGQANDKWPELIEETYLVKLRVRPLPLSSPRLSATTYSRRAPQENSTALQPMRDMVEETIDLDELDRHQYVIKPEFDETLGEIKAQLEAVRDSLDEEHGNVARDLDMDTDNKTLHFEQHSLYGYCFRLTRKVRSRPSPIL